MATNAFDQFDSAPNAFNQFDAPSKPKFYSFRDAHGNQIMSTDPKGGGLQPWKGYNPTDSMDWIGRGLAGYGEASKHLWEGIEQAGLSLAGAIAPKDNSLSSLVTGDHRNWFQKKSDEIGDTVKEEHRLDRPLNSTTGGAVGNVLGNMVPMVAIPAEGVFANAAVSGGAAALQPLERGQGAADRFLNTALGAGLGGAGAAGTKLLGMIAQPIKNRLTPLAKAAVDKLQQAGVPLDLAQRTGSDFLQKIKSGLSSLPVTGGWARENEEAQKRAFTAAALRTIGADSEHASPSVMGEAKNRIGSIFNEQAKRGLTMDEGLISDLGNIESQMKRTVPESSHGLITRQVNDLLNGADSANKLDGSLLQRVQSDLGQLTTNKDVGGIAGDMRSALASAMQRQGTVEDAQALQAARVQYRNMKQIEGAIGNDENISAKKLANALRSPRNRNQSIYGMGDQELPQLAKSAAAILPETVGNSGTADRHAAMAMIGGTGAVAAPLAFATYHSLSPDKDNKGADWNKALTESGGILGAVLAAKAAKGAFASPLVSNYLARGFGGSPDSLTAAQAARQLLTAPQNNAYLGTLLRQLPPSLRLALPGPAQQ